ncbi:flagellar protein FliT [Thiohalobacter sp. IOR34]|uniref:flagellar protein FliT n=1 Tax=Thiohalobacter sp. IOR34 TaxID=3057176 RepID=UPI0025B00AED|nr:flagellar protein FliT [Thiohalobacter sp. IOR34]WJW74580.1 flagellar protein FliT [Thiohalobacter sp. IOR34]
MAELDSLLVLTRDLRAAAEAGDWERVVTLEAERGLCIERLFAELPAGNEPQLRQAILEIQSSDQEVMRLAQARRQWLGEQLQTIARGRSAVSAYRTNGGG